MNCIKNKHSIGFLSSNRNNRGFTLLEIIITLAILSLLIAILFSLNSFGIKSFANSKDRSQKQYEVMMAANFITEELRFAKAATILNTVPTPTAGYYDIYVDTNNKILFNKNGVTTNVIGLSDGQDFSLAFTKASDNVISYTAGIYGNTQYDTNTELIILNIKAPNKIEGSTSGIGVRFEIIEPMTDAQIVEADKSWLNISLPAIITNDLPVSGPNGSLISWAAIVGVVDTNGKITRPTDTDIPVTLTATIIKGSDSITISIPVTIKMKNVSATISLIDSINDTININENYIMPATVEALMSDGTTENVPVVWSPNKIDTSSVGDKICNGTVSGYSTQITLKVSVVVLPLGISNIGAFKDTVIRKTYYEYTFIPEGGSGTISFNYTNLPISWLHSDNGKLSGTAPNDKGVKYEFTVIISDTSGNNRSYPLSITVLKE